jgi:serine/threonine-protein kinase
MGEVTAGDVIRGRYRLDHRLGQGGMGAVWSAMDLELRRPVAIKLIIPDFAEDPGILSRFLREARSAASLASPHVVRILDFGMDGERAFIAMERLEGETLGDRLKREGRLRPEVTARILSHVGRAVALAHEAHLVHRDLKPDNVFLVKGKDASDAEVHAKVLDFGLAKSLQVEEGPDSTRTDTGVMLGSPYYMSPEQARGRRELDPRSDLWSMGVIAYECITGLRPFVGSSLGEVILMICVEPPPVPSEVAQVPEGFDEWFARATARDAAARFQSAKELTDSLCRLLAPDGAPASDEAARDAETAPRERGDSDAPPPATLRGAAATRPSSQGPSLELQATKLPRTRSSGPPPGPAATGRRRPSPLALAGAAALVALVVWLTASQLGLLPH